MLVIPRSVAPDPGGPPVSPPKRLVSENDFPPVLSDFICKGERLVCIPQEDDVYADVEGAVDATAAMTPTMVQENFMMLMMMGEA